MIEIDHDAPGEPGRTTGQTIRSRGTGHWRQLCPAAFLLLWLLTGDGRARGQTPLTPPGLAARAEGSWSSGGVYPTTIWPASLANVEPGRRPRVWGSHSGSDAGVGSFALGSFRVPANGRFVVALAGYPAMAGNALTVRRLSDGSSQPVDAFNPGETWAEVLVRPPRAWAGQEVELVAVDGATGLGGWLGLSEPYDRAFGPVWDPRLRVPDYPLPAGRFLPAILGALALNAVFLLGPGLCLLPALRRRLDTPDALALLLAFGLSAGCGYALFWVYCADALVGRAASWLVTVASLTGLAIQALRGGRRLGRALGGRETLGAAGLTALVGVFYLAVLYVPAPNVSQGLLAERRFSEKGMANDNVLPQGFAERLYLGQETRPFLTGDWHASDRPPLQTGWQLLARPLTLAILRLHPDVTDQAAGVLFQLAWVPAAWALLRGAGLGRGAAAQVLAAVVPTGFLFLNSVYTWPKLGGAALTVGSFVLLLRSGQSRRPTVGQAALAGALAGLGLLSHGAVAFGLLGLVPFLLLPGLFPGWRQSLAGLMACVLLNVPWVLYGKFYDPPANRLLKWHLAGVIPIDERGFGQTLRENYAAAGWAGAWANKRANAAYLFGGDFLRLTSLSPREAEGHRHDEFFHSFRALGVWNLGWWAGLALLARAAWRRWGERVPWPAGTGTLFLAVGVSVLAIILWCLLMFGPNATAIVQGAYLPLLLLFLCLATFLAAASPALFATVALFNAALFATTYVPAPAGLAAASAELDPLGLAVAGAAGVGLLACALAPVVSPSPSPDAARRFTP